MRRETTLGGRMLMLVRGIEDAQRQGDRRHETVLGSKPHRVSKTPICSGDMRSPTETVPGTNLKSLSHQSLGLGAGSGGSGLGGLGAGRGIGGNPPLNFVAVGSFGSVTQ